MGFRKIRVSRDTADKWNPSRPSFFSFFLRICTSVKTEKNKGGDFWLSPFVAYFRLRKIPPPLFFYPFGGVACHSLLMNNDGVGWELVTQEIATKVAATVGVSLSSALHKVACLPVWGEHFPLPVFFFFFFFLQRLQDALASVHASRHRQNHCPSLDSLGMVCNF